MLNVGCVAGGRRRGWRFVLGECAVVKWPRHGHGEGVESVLIVFVCVWLFRWLEDEGFEYEMTLKLFQWNPGSFFLDAFLVRGGRVNWMGGFIRWW